MDWQNEVSGQQRTPLVEDDPFAEYRMGSPRIEPARVAEAPAAISQPHDPFAEFRFGSSQIMPTVFAAGGDGQPMVVAAQHEVRNPPPPGAAPPHRHLTPAERESVNLQIIRRGENLMSEVFQNNTWENATGWAAEQFLRGLTLGFWGGTGLSQLPQWQRDVEARRRIVGPEYPADRVTPEDWRNLYADVMGRTDQLGRRWGNCGEMAGSLAHIIHGMINDATRYPNMAGMQVRQAFGSNPGHSWVEVRDSRGQVTVYDPWARVTGPLERVDESYRRQNIAYTPWFGRRP